MMAPLSVSDVTEQIDKLLEEYQNLQRHAKYDDLSDLKVESAAFVVRLRAAIERLAPPASTYIKETAAITDQNQGFTAIKIRSYVGVLQALRADVNEDWLAGVYELLHADTFGDFINQAGELSRKKYDNAAAVVVGSTLEAHLRLLCNKFGVGTSLPSGQHVKAETMNAELVKASAYNTLQQKAVTGWLAIRNAAAHGDYSYYTREQVLNMISSVRDFILAHPA
jgi:hypothetical protein